jgi:GTP-binding protein HflX
LTGGIGGRGPGETKLEIGRRRVEEKITRLEKELKSLKHRRGLNRVRRDKNNIPVVSIVGYTNAGKSTLLNAMTNSDVLAENRLFATLDPTTRRLRFPEEREIILSDTVGFIHDLPPELRRAFEATLEELRESSLLLVCIDATDREREAKIRAVETILHDMDLSEIPRLKVYNKCENLSQAEIENLIDSDSDSIAISALHKKNLENLLVAVEHFIFSDENVNTSQWHLNTDARIK